jgi:hypothetical protein
MFVARLTLFNVQSGLCELATVHHANLKPILWLLLPLRLTLRGIIVMLIRQIC